MAATVSALVNGGKRVTPHFGVRILDKDKETVRELKYDDGKQIVSEETSRTMQALLESVVSEGSGKNAKIEGYHIGGKTATSQTLPRSANKYISSFIGFAPADNPQILGMVVIHNPQGVYYGGTIAAPVLQIFLTMSCRIWGLKRIGYAVYCMGYFERKPVKTKEMKRCIYE